MSRYKAFGRRRGRLKPFCRANPAGCQSQSPAAGRQQSVQICV
ncbi:hypothetical protein [Kingella potus]|nr:hypothetical protein [Kingella potus]